MKNALRGLSIMTLLVLCAWNSVYAQSGAFASVTLLQSLTVSAITGEKPQSKAWTYAGKWWAVMPNSSGTHIWRLDGTSWTSVLDISAATSTYADCKATGSVTHILLYQGTSSSLVSVEYVPATGTYQLWTTRTSTVALSLDAGVETAVIDIDGNGRMWLASAGTTDINVRWSDSPYSSWSSPITIATGVNDDDICAAAAFNGRMGVLWSNQNTQRFGFKYHVDGADPATWSPDEVPASQSAQNVGAGMADDHINLAVATDGTIYAAVKTSYDASPYPKIAMLVRRPGGTWDNLYAVDVAGTRGIVILNEAAGKVKVIYSASESGGDILYKESPTSSISFGTVNTLISGGTYNNATSTKQNYSDNIVVLAGTGSTLVGVLASDANVNAYALDFDGSNDYVNCGTSASADITGPITLEAWVRSDLAATQSIIKKNGTNSGYELSLSNNAAGGLPQNFFFRLNASDTYRVNSTTYYPIDGTWAHVAATYDGSVMKLYVNGVQEGGTVAGPASIATNTNNVLIGTDPTTPGTGKNFNGGIDEVRVWNVARTAQEILENYTRQISAGTGLIGRWGMPEGTGTTTANAVTGALNGTLMDGTLVGNGPLWISSTPFNITAGPAVPVLASPANGATGISVNPTVSWNASSGATTYRAQVSTAADFSTTVSDQSGIASTSASVTGLSNGTVYYWRINATNAQGTSAWSAVWSFTTAGVVLPVESNGSGYALDFDGTNGAASSDYVNCGNAASLDITQSLTIEAWVKPTATKTHSIVKKYAITSSGYELFLENATNGRISFRLNGSTTYRVNSTSYYNQPLSTWIHVAGTYDYSTKLMKIFINGKEEGSIAGPASIVSLTSALVIGAELTDFSKSFQGNIDEVRVWNIARTEADIRATMTRKLLGTESGLAGYWRFDETSGTSVNDETANNNDGTMINMDPATDHVWSGAALGTASANDYDATGGYTASLSHPNGDALTATTTSGTIAGIQVYRADDNASRTGSTVPPGYTADPLRFWGVRALGTSTPTYTLVYNYSGYPGITDEAGLKLLKRADHAVAAWVDASAVLDMNANTLTLTGATGTEYALGLPLATTHTIAAAAGSHGSLSPAGPSVTVNHGADQTFTLTPETGYHVATLVVDGVPRMPASSFTFQNVTANGHTIAVSFAQDSYSITRTTPPDPAYDLDNNGDGVTDMRASFSTLPRGGGSLSVRITPNTPFGYQLPPPDSISFCMIITSSLTNHAFSATISLDVSLYPGFGANPYMVYYDNAATAWVLAAGSYNASDPAFGGHKSFTFTTDHFTQYAFVTLASPPKNLYVSTSPTSAAAGVVYPGATWNGGYPGRENDWSFTGTQPFSLYIVPETGTTFGACDLHVYYDSAVVALDTVLFAGSVFSGGNLLFAVSDRLGSGNSVTIDASLVAPTNVTAQTGHYIAELKMRIKKPGHGIVSLIGTTVVSFNAESSPSGVDITPHQAEIKAYLGDVASAGPVEASGDGKIDYDDLLPWSGAYWSGVSPIGMTNYKSKYDIGPTQNGYVFSLPMADARIEFEDLVIFSIVYGQSARHELPKVPVVANEPLVVSLGRGINTGNEVRVPVMIAGGVADVRAMKLELSGDFGSFLGVHRGELLQPYETPVMLMHRSEGHRAFVDLAVMGLDAQGLTGKGEVVVLRFAGTTAVRLNNAECRNSANRALTTNLEKGTVGTLPAAFSLGQNYPNPFNPTTIIEYELPRGGQVTLDVFNILGEAVATLVNEVQDAGYYHIQWNGKDGQNRPVAAGVYLYRVKAGEFTSVKKMVLLK